MCLGVGSAGTRSCQGVAVADQRGPCHYSRILSPLQLTTMTIASIAPAVRAARRLSPLPVRAMNFTSFLFLKPSLLSLCEKSTSAPDLALHDAGSRPERSLRLPVATFRPSPPPESFVAHARQPSVLL